MIMPNLFSRLLWVILLFSTACGLTDEEAARRAAVAKQTDTTKTAPDGMAIFRQKCVLCHGSDGTLGINGAKDLSQSILTLEERINIIANGKKLMTPFGTILSPEEIQAVAEYTQTFKK